MRASTRRSDKSRNPFEEGQQALENPTSDPNPNLIWLQGVAMVGQAASSAPGHKNVSQCVKY